MRRLLSRLFLATALVLAQHGVYAHALSHVEKDLHGNDGGAKVNHGQVLCAAFTPVSCGAVGSGDLPQHADAPPDRFAGPAPADPLLCPLALTRFASRAPPLPA